MLVRIMPVPLYPHLSQNHVRLNTYMYNHHMTATVMIQREPFTTSSQQSSRGPLGFQRWTDKSLQLSCAKAVADSTSDFRACTLGCSLFESMPVGGRWYHAGYYDLPNVVVQQHPFTKSFASGHPRQHCSSECELNSDR